MNYTHRCDVRFAESHILVTVCIQRHIEILDCLLVRFDSDLENGTEVFLYRFYFTRASFQYT